MRFRCLKSALLFSIPLLFAGCGGDASDDGEVDDSTTDVDQDGFPASVDCDDNNPTIHPEATELCNGLDDNCDGTPDDASATNASTWHRDADGDSYGAPGGENEIRACTAPAGYVGSVSDCDDNDGDVNPAADETCGDEIDNNCDGSGQGCGLSGEIGLEDATASFIGEAQDHRAGAALAGAGDVNGDGFDDFLISAVVAPGGGLTAGTVYLYYGGRAFSGASSLADADARLLGVHDSDYTGYSVSGGDVDGDGKGDLLIGAPFDDTNGSSSGTVYLVYGPVSGDVELENAPAIFRGERSGDQAGASVSATGDINGDGYADVLIGARNHDTGSSDAGSVYLFYGPVSGELQLSDADARIDGSGNYAQVGYSVAGVRDLDGDGNDDVLVGAPGLPVDGDSLGGAFVFLGPISGALELEDADAALYGTTELGKAGQGVGTAGDVNGDGLNDLLVTAPYDDAAGDASGSVYVLFGPVEASQDLADADLILTGARTGDQSGYSAASADVNGDGFSDLLVGTLGDARTRATRVVYIVYGPQDGTVNLSNADATIVPVDENAYLGYSTASAGDVNGDGYEDILTGIPDNSEDDEFHGEVYLFLGSTGL